MTIWTVYKNPKDYPSLFVTRAWHIKSDDPEPLKDVLIDETLDGLRAKISVGLVRIERETGDDPCIVEVWL